MCIIIAEAGENHLGDMDIARKLVDLAKVSGADYVKFQYYDARDCSDSDPEKEWFKKVAMDIRKLEELYNYAGKKGIGFLCTPWDAGKALDLFNLGVRDMKIASFHITDYEMLRLVNEKADRVFISTGMCSLEEVDRAVEIMDRAEIYLLHCVSEYPLTEERVNLKIMDFLRKRYRRKVGYSDHTTGILAPVAAVARGADAVEKHITLSKDYPGTDHVLSADPAELKLLVEEIRRIELILGKPDKKMTESELKNQLFMRNRFSYNKK